MNKNSTIEKPYMTPTIVEVAFKSEGPLCLSLVGFGIEAFEEDADLMSIDF